MKYSSLNLTACPICHKTLAYIGADAPTLQTGTLICSHCERHFPMDLVPDATHVRKLFDVWKGWLYCIEFVKP